MFVAHLDGIEVADINADGAQDASPKVNLELVYYLAPAALALGIKRVILHLGAHALGRAVADTDHTSGAIRLVYLAVPC